VFWWGILWLFQNLVGKGIVFLKKNNPALKKNNPIRPVLALRLREKW
jgi:hypothetical protein